MSVGDAEELSVENTKLKRLVAEVELEKLMLKKIANENSEPKGKTMRCDLAPGNIRSIRTVRVQSYWAPQINPAQAAQT
jgi:hypothetical protein